MTTHTHYLWFETKKRQEIIDITDQVAEQVRASGVREGMVLVSAMHITASVFVNDHESGLWHDILQWLEGTIAPAYIVNSILGNIPVIGEFLQGGKGEGIFAATYKAKGSLDEPEITVNPLSALAPGFLRGMFDIFDGEGGGERVTPRALPEPGKHD